MKANQATHPVRVMCRLLKVSASGFYAWDVRPLSARARADIGLTARIHAIHRRSRGAYGAPNIHAELADDHGIHVGCKRVARLMRAAGLRGVMAQRFVRTTVSDATQAVSSDRVDREFKAAGPDQLWVAYITYIPTWAGFLYLAVVLDVWSRKIVGWARETHLRTALVLTALDAALTQRRPRQVIHHSDHGCQPGFNWSSQRIFRSDLTSKIFIAMQSDADASEGGARCGARSWSRPSSQNLVERFGRRSPAERLSRSAVEGDSNCVELSLRISADVRTFGKVLPQQSVGVLVRSSLPRTLRVAKVHLQSGIDPKLSMLGELGSLIPGQRSSQLRWQHLNLLRDGVADSFGAATS